MVRLLKQAEARRERSVQERTAETASHIKQIVSPEFFPKKPTPGAAEGGDNRSRAEFGGASRLHKQQGRHTLKLIYSKYGCSNPCSPWGFDESFPSCLNERMQVEHWQDAIAQLNAGYLRSPTPKLIWLPLIVLTVIGAILEGSLRTGDEVPVGIVLGVCAGAGLLLSFLWSMYTRSIVALEMQRLRIVCSQLNEKYGRLGITFDVDEDDLRKSVVMIVHETGVNVHIKHLQPRTLNTDTHVMQINMLKDSTQVELTERKRPLQEVPPGHIFIIGEGEKADRERRLAEHVSWKREPTAGWCTCTAETKKYTQSLGWAGRIEGFLGEDSLAQRADTDGQRIASRVLWNNTSLKICPVCNKAINGAQVGGRT